MTRTYNVTRPGRDISTDNAATAASIACSWKRDGYMVSASVSFIKDAGVRFAHVPVSTVRETAKAFREAANA